MLCFSFQLMIINVQIINIGLLKIAFGVTIFLLVLIWNLYFHLLMPLTEACLVGMSPVAVKRTKVELPENQVLKLMVGMFCTHFTAQSRKTMLWIHTIFQISLVFWSYVLCLWCFLVLSSYTFCGLATMILIKEVNRLDLASLTVRTFSAS